MSEGPEVHPAPEGETALEGEPTPAASGPVREWPPAPPDTWPSAVPVVQAGRAKTPTDQVETPETAVPVELPQEITSDTPSVMDPESS